MNLKENPGQIILLVGIVLGNLEWLLLIIYNAASEWYSDSAKSLCTFLIILPILYYPLSYLFYVAQHDWKPKEGETDSQNRYQLKHMLKMTWLYFLLMFFRILPSVDLLH